MGCIYKRGSIYWIKYYRNGKPYLELTPGEKETTVKNPFERKRRGGRKRAVVW